MGDVSTAEPAGQLDRRARLGRVLARDGEHCVWCRRPFDARVRPTTDHLVPRLKGGPSWLENELAACARCNGQRGHTAPVPWLAECRRRGWDPDAEAVSAGLLRLARAVRERGGQRRAAAYVDGQLRRWRRLG
jgi:hypothetical protein